MKKTLWMLLVLMSCITMVLSAVSVAEETKVTVNRKEINALLLSNSLVGDTEKVKLLLGLGADVNTTDKDGRTPLINASEKGFTEIVKLLLE